MGNKKVMKLRGISWDPYSWPSVELLLGFYKDFQRDSQNLGDPQYDDLTAQPNFHS